VSQGVLLRSPDKVIEGKAKSAKLPVIVMADIRGPWATERVLIVEPKTAVPWELVPAAWHLLERWDAAAPLWRYGVLAADLGTPEEQKRTAAIVHDLRIPVYACELLFVRNSQAGQELVRIWQEECAHGDSRLAFVRALYQVKPLFCALPRSWLADVEQRSHQDARTMASLARVQGPALSKVEIAPGRWVRCRPGEEERVKAQFERLTRRHGERSTKGRQGDEQCCGPHQDHFVSGELGDEAPGGWGDSSGGDRAARVDQDAQIGSDSQRTV
jgi:hypothetical protein